MIIFNIFYSSYSFHISTGLSAYFFLKILLRNKKIVYTIHSVKKMPKAMTAFVKDFPANPSKNSNGATMTIAGKFERIYLNWKLVSVSTDRFPSLRSYR